MARGARSTPLKQGPGGRLASGRSKTGDPACSQAMSLWVRARHGGAAVAAEVFKVLAGCRAKARAQSLSRDHAIAGNVARSQVYARRAERGLSGAARDRLAAEQRGVLARRRAARAAAKASPKSAGFSLKQESAAGKKAFRTEDTGAGRTGTLFDMKKGDLPGQTSLLERVGSRESNPRAARYSRMGAPSEVHDELARVRAGRAAELRAGRREGGAKVEDDAARLHRAFAKHPHAADNQVPIYQLRDATGLPRERFDAAFRHLQERGHFAAESSEGHGNAAAGLRRRGIDTRRLHDEGIKQGGSAHLEDDRKPFSMVGIRQDSTYRPHAEASPTDRQLARHLPRVAGGSPEDILRRGREAIERRKKLAGHIRAQRSVKLEHEMPERYGKPGTPYEMHADKIAFDPDRFQYKLAAQGQHGVTDQLRDVRKWDPELAGTIAVWRDPADGKTYVVNGHHRLDLARRLGVKSISVKYLDAPTAEKARAKGALVNIAEGRGTAVDAAKFFRDSGLDAEAVRAKGISFKEHTASQGLALAALPERAFRRVVGGEMSVNRAAIIGGGGLSHAQQEELIKVLDQPKNRRLTDGTVRHMVEDAAHSLTKKKEERTLFGTTEAEQSLLVNRGKVADAIKKGLAADKRLFGLVSKSKHAAALAERGRSHIDTEETGKIGQEAGSVLALFHQLRNRDPHISRALNDASERIHHGDNAKAVEADARRKITRRIKDILEGDVDPFA